MRNILLLATIGVITAAASMPAAGASRDRARAMALAECNQQARQMMYGRRAIQRRNFVKECMVDRGYHAGVN